MGLAAPKNRTKISDDPNNNAWSRNTTRFGHRILTSQGWTPGGYLGAKEAAHASHYTAANASHIRIALKDGNLGLGAKRGRADHDETFGLSVLQGLFGRINGKNDEEIQKKEQTQRDVKLRLYGDRRWGMRFVSAGYLVGDKIEDIKQDEEAAVSQPVKTEGSSEVESGKESSKKSDKKRKRDAAEEDGESDDAPTKKPKSSKDGSSKSSKRSKSEKKAKRKSKSRSASSDPSEEDQEAAEATSSAEPSSDSDKKRRKAERKAEKAERKRQKEEKKARKEAKRLKQEDKQRLKDSKSTSKDSSQDSDSSSDESDAPQKTKAKPSPSVPQPSVPPSLLSGRQVVRQRYIKQKRMASMDPQALKEIFMIQAKA